ncbi:MAG: efflux RND transporter periplasmic adaptor subunit [Bacteroidetes bacterium]|jgi:multidrug efflux pump subunit AcrA (membrane-fusion protein)|nr:efflux RND transporter periplasmic adaptor subunit [Bacteroidota bacterium]
MSFQKTIIPIALILILGGVYYFVNGSNEKVQANNLSTTVQQGEFKIYVAATGELKARNSVKIKGPRGMRNAGIYRTTISDLVAEGSVVEEGDYVATLDRTELDTKMKEIQNALDKILTQLDQAKIDTAIELRGIRDDLINLKFGMKEKELQVEQSRYEPQMVIRQAEIDLEKSKRDYSQLEQKAELTKTKSIAKISEFMASLRQEQLKLQRLVDLSDKFIINAPKDGMVIYARSWEGKIGPGSQISSWDATVAELPDLTEMISKTFVNEVDISKVQKGQETKIKVDAFPDNEYSGTIIQVANIGEQLRGYDSKVFEVTIEVNESDSILRPAMTTSIEILTYIYQDVLFVPLEGLYSDSLTFVYKKDKGKIVKQEVVTSETNDNEIMIEFGLAPGDEILLVEPENADNLSLYPIDPNQKKSLLAKIEQQRIERQKEALARAQKVRNYVPSREGGGGNFMIFN